MKQNQNVITWNSAYYNKYGIELSQDLNTIRITARCLPSEFNLTDEEKEDMTLEEVEQEQKSRWERSWKWFIPWLSDTLQGAVLFEWDKTMKDRLVSRAPKEIIVDKNHPYLSARDGVLFNKEQTELLWYPYGR